MRKYPFYKTYPSLLPRVFMSPIEEIEEKSCHLVQTFERNSAENKNMSVIHIVISQPRCNTKYSQDQANNRICESDKELTESASGFEQRSSDKGYTQSYPRRNHDGVKYLKQKYINSEIQDLRSSCPVRYGHIGITRSTHPGYPNTRNQKIKIRVKPGSSDLQSAEAREQEYRCMKYTDRSYTDACNGITKSDDDLMYQDDYEPELEALLEHRCNRATLPLGMSSLGDLDGWKTKTTAFIDQDNLYLSSTEFIHPINSSEMFYSPLWNRPRSTPLLSSRDKKATIVSGKGADTQVSSRCEGLHMPTLHSWKSVGPDSTLSDPAYTCSNVSVGGSKAVKPRPSVSDDYRKAQQLVKLRLTKSSGSVGNKSSPYANNFVIK